MKSIIVLLSFALTEALGAFAGVPFEISGTGLGSIAISSTSDSALVSWKDKAGRICSAQLHCGIVLR